MTQQEVGGRRVLLDVVDQRNAAEPERRPDLVELAAKVPCRMQAVVDEHLDRAEVADERRKKAAARAAQERPPRVEAFRHRRSRLLSEVAFQERGEIDAPEFADSVPLDRLEQ
jgi:hypothetical protein